MADKLKYIPNEDTQNYYFCILGLDTQLNEPTYQIKVIKVDKPTNKKTLLYNFGDQCNKQPNVPSLPGNNVICNMYVCLGQFVEGCVNI